MGDTLDRDELLVYTRILKLSSDVCPPNHYVLLGVSTDEQCAKTIEAAAHKRVEQLRRGASGELLRPARIVLKKIQRAQTCLLDSQARNSYDFAMRGEFSPSQTASIWDELDVESVESSAPSLESPRRLKSDASGIDLGAVPPRQLRQQHRRSQPNRTIAIYIAGLSAVLIVCITAIIYWPRTGGGETKVATTASEASAVREQSLSSQKNENESRSETTSLEKTETSSKDVASLSIPHSSLPEQAATTDLTSFQSRENVGLANPPASNGTSADEISTEVANDAIPSEVSTVSPLAVNSLHELPDAIDLPVQRKSGTALHSDGKSSDGVADLGTVPPDGLTVAIDQPEILSVSGITFEATPDTAHIPGPAWQLRLVSIARQSADDEKSTLDDVAAGLDEVVAKLFVDDGRLKFGWSNSKYAQLAEQLRNCVLCVSYNGQQHRLQLRPYQKVAPVVLDFEKSVHSFEIDGEVLPASESLFLQVMPSPAFAQNASVPESGIVPCKKVLTLNIFEDEHCKVEVRALLRPKGDGYTIAIGPRFKMGTKWLPFTTERVNAGLQGLEKALPRQREKLAAAQSRASSLRSSLSTVNSRMASSDDARERHALSVQARGLQVKLGSAQRAITRGQQSIPDTQRDIEIMKKIAEAGNRIRGRAELQLRVGVRTTNGEYDLLRTDDSLAVVTESP